MLFKIEIQFFSFVLYLDYLQTVIYSSDFDNFVGTPKVSKFRV